MTESDRAQHDHFLRLFMEQEEALRVFVRSLLFTHDEVREVMAPGVTHKAPLCLGRR